MISLEEYLILSALLFCISIAGIIINRKNILILLMAIEPVSYTHLTLPTS